ncbi:hypothetical protein K1719_011659 [Acacia pycnantha]|nr:hypothetical protein K1719_011659 [Acacia pycnantha]
MTHLLTLLLIPLVAVIFVQASQTNPDDLRNLLLHLQYNLVAVTICSVFLVFESTVYIMMLPRSVYLVDFSCYLPPPHLQFTSWTSLATSLLLVYIMMQPRSNFMEHSRLTGDFEESSLEFQRKILEFMG